MTKIHLFGEYFIIESDHNTAVYLTDTQFRILCMYSDGLSIKEIFNGLIGDDFFSEEQFYQASLNIKSLTEQFIKEKIIIKKPIHYSGKHEKYYPMILNIELTNQCNFRCTHCYKEADSQKTDFLDSQIIDDIINLYSGKIKTIHLTGGEPLIYPHINETIKKLSEHFSINITTNGSLLHKIDDIAIKRVNNIQISLYGFDENSYEVIAKNKQGFHQVTQSLSRLNDLSVTYDVSVTANQIFIEKYDKYIPIIKTNYVNRILVGLPYLEGRANHHQDLWTLSEKDLQKLYFIEDEFGLHHNTEVVKDSFQVNSYGKTPFEMCGAGSIMYTINEKGELLHCTSLSKMIHSIGTIRDIEQRSQLQPVNFRKIVENIRRKHTFHSPMCPLLGEDE